MDMAETDSDRAAYRLNAKNTTMKRRELLPRDVDSSHLYPALVEGGDGKREVRNGIH